jgi:hypothetical protein
MRLNHAVKLHWSICFSGQMATFHFHKVGPGCTKRDLAVPSAKAWLLAAPGANNRSGDGVLVVSNRHRLDSGVPASVAPQCNLRDTLMTPLRDAVFKVMYS